MTFICLMNYNMIRNLSESIMLIFRTFSDADPECLFSPTRTQYIGILAPCLDPECQFKPHRPSTSLSLSSSSFWIYRTRHCCSIALPSVCFPRCPTTILSLLLHRLSLPSLCKGSTPSEECRDKCAEPPMKPHEKGTWPGGC